MPPKITRVRWSAVNIPYGMAFSEINGVFSGEPEVEGEYIIPVTVETNYGKDTKNVVITVAPHTYGVWVKPSKWQVSGSQPDTNGFYPVNVPNVAELSPYAYGFRAYTQFGDIYGCGLTGMNVNWGTVFTYSNSTARIEPYTSSSNVKCLTDVFSAYNVQHSEHRIYSYATLTKENIMTITQNLYYEVPIASNPGYHNSYLKAISGETVKNMPVSSVISTGSGFRWLSEDGMQDCRFSYSVNRTSHTASARIQTTNLDYKAIKIMRATPFTYLSENHYLDNNPDNFTLGTIKDVWGLGNSVYVQTTDNRLYEYDLNSASWNFLGAYDIKKVEVPNANCIFFLTNDGKLFHKGSMIINILTEAHNTLTHIFPTQTFKDFTYVYNSQFSALLVLKE